MGTIDTRLLRAAVEGVEEGLRDMRRTMPPRKKADLVEAAYLLLAEDRQDEARARTVLAGAAWDADAPSTQDEGRAALFRLMEVAQGHSGQCKRVAAFLLGLYNGDRFPFDLTELRALDASIMDDCLQVLRMDYQPVREVHEYFEDGGRRFEQLAKDWRIEDRAVRGAPAADAAGPIAVTPSMPRKFHHNPVPPDDLI
jgi:hypothetical protein